MVVIQDFSSVSFFLKKKKTTRFTYLPTLIKSFDTN